MNLKNYLRIPAVTLCLTFLGTFTVTAQDPFITKWKTDNEGYGTSQPDQIVVPLTGEYTYTWEDITNPAINGTGSGSDTLWLTFPFAGTYRLSLTPTGTNPLSQIMFGGNDDVVKIIDIEQWGDVAWSTMQHAFWGAMNMTISATDIPDLSNVYDMTNAFRETPIDIIPNIENWDVSNVNYMVATFYQAENFNSPIGSWNVCNVVDMYKMFSGATSFNQPLADWDVSNVIYFSSMFENAMNFNQPIGNWNMSYAEELDYMFAFAKNFNQPIGDWDLSNATNMSGMFYFASSFNQPIGNWSTSNVYTMAFMFTGASAFNQPIGDWDLGNVFDLYAMFALNSAFNQPIGDWNLSAAEDISMMFQNAVSFNQPLDKWNVSNVQYMYQIFTNATSFDQNIGSWDLSSVQQPQYIDHSISLKNCGMSCENYSYTLHGWAANKTTPSNLILLANGLEYSPDIASDRAALISDKNWTITGDIEGTCSVSVEAKNHSLSRINILPNPATDYIIVTGLTGDETLVLTDINGKIIKTVKAGDFSLEIRLDGLTPGIYNLAITAGNGVTTGRKVVKR